MNYEISTLAFIVIVVVMAAIFLSLAIYIVGQMEKIGELEKPIEYECENCGADVSHEEILGSACSSCMCGSNTARRVSWYKLKRR